MLLSTWVGCSLVVLLWKGKDQRVLVCVNKTFINFYIKQIYTWPSSSGGDSENLL